MAFLAYYQTYLSSFIWQILMCCRELFQVLLFFSYIYNLYIYIYIYKSATKVCFHLFADDSCQFYLNTFLQKMEIEANISNWVKANKQTLNVKIQISLCLAREKTEKTCSKLILAEVLCVLFTLMSFSSYLKKSSSQWYFFQLHS